MASYAGDGTVLGRTVSIVVNPNPSDAQYDTFFGQGGVFSLYGGSRGRVFLVSGFLFGADLGSLDAARDNLWSFDDGVGRELVDNLGHSWPLVVYKQFSQQDIIRPGPGGYYLKYSLVFEGRL